MQRVIQRAAHLLGLDIRRFTPAYVPGIVSLRPDGPARGRVLLAYILDPFLRKPDSPISTAHTNHGESLIIADVFRGLGYHVDVIDYRNSEFKPETKYDFFVSARTNLERIADLLDPACVTIAHLDTAHYLFNNAAAYARALALKQRRGAVCHSIRIVEPNRAIERADYGALLGGDFLEETYAYAGKPLFRLPIPAMATYPSPVAKDFASCRRRFLWFGSKGFVHKGLDLVLEAFAEMPEAELLVCGPIADEPQFVNLYRRELYELPNIRTLGWIDVTSPRFLEITQSCIALVFPSCSESASASSITCMHAGLIPMLTREAGVPFGDYGSVLTDPSIDGIRQAIADLIAMPTQELKRRAVAAWDYARSHHTREQYRLAYHRMIERILRDRQK